jgi:hypothetical protein
LTNIAQNRLLDVSPDSLDQANQMLAFLQAYDPELTYREVNHTFVECSTFADDVKYHGHAWQSDFHFEAKLWTPPEDPGTYEQDLKKHNMTYGSAALIQWLSVRDDGEHYKQSYIYDYIQNRLYPGEPLLAQSFALRLLIHYIGDMHQPFHNEALYSEAYPDGDKGANEVLLKYHYGVDELHALWDKVMYTQRTSIARPITDAVWPGFQEETIQMAYDGRSALSDPAEYENIDVLMWSDESYQIAITKYDGIIPSDEETVVPQWYLDENLQVCWDRLTLGGYRLAHIMEYIYPSRSEAFLQ